MPEAKFYILKNGRPVLVRDVAVWGRWFDSSFESRVVEQTIVGGKYKVSTVFLGLDHNFSGEGRPILFESMVFTADGMKTSDVLDIRRYSTLGKAKQGHFEYVEMLKKKIRDERRKKVRK